jgi:hypothetical protein
LRHLGDFRRGLIEGFLALFVFCEIEKKTRFFESRLLLLPSIDDVFE